MRNHITFVQSLDIQNRNPFTSRIFSMYLKGPLSRPTCPLQMTDISTKKQNTCSGAHFFCILKGCPLFSRERQYLLGSIGKDKINKFLLEMCRITPKNHGTPKISAHQFCLKQGTYFIECHAPQEFIVLNQYVGDNWRYPFLSNSFCIQIRLPCYGVARLIITHDFV